MLELTSLNVLGKRYRMTKKKCKGQPDGYMGLCSDDTATIYLAKNLREGEEYWTTLFHELGHGVLYRNGVRFSGAVSMEVEEIIVETMSNAYYNCFKQILKGIIKSGDIDTIYEEVEAFSRDTK